jgi:DedD protein
MNETQDAELTLSTGKLLGVFFVLVVICGIFFSLGYAVGKNSTPSAGVAIMDSSQLSTVTASGASKPLQGKPVTEANQPACAEGDANCAPAAEKTNPAPDSATEVKTSAAPEMATPGAGLMVQVAAVSKQEDAEALVAALRKKQYPVLIVPNQTSHLFHVQVGPFPDSKEAEAMRARLASDGYNAIVKR